MDEDEVLEKGQLKTYNELSGRYTFVCEGAGVTSLSSPLLNAKKNGIRLHFLRLGLFDNNDHNHVEVLAPGEIASNESIKVSGCPELSSFYFAPTYLNPGYIYIIDANNKNLFWEYEVNELGLLTPILWEKNKKNGKYNDVRHSVIGSEEYVTYKKDSDLWIAYSPVQWSIAYHSVILNNDERRKERMIRLKCSGFEKGDNGSDEFVNPFDNVKGKFNEFQGPQAMWHQKKIFSLYNEENSPYAPKEMVREDMFIALDDPIGCANDINAALSEKCLRFKALINSIETGNSQEEEYEKILAGNFESTAKNKELQDLSALALFCYQYVYNSEESIREYDGGLTVKNKGRRQRGAPAKITSAHREGVDVDKVVGILGLTERNELRNAILSYRNDFGTFLKCNYFKKVLEDYLHNISPRTLEGRAVLFEMLHNLFQNPYNFDRHLLLAKDYKREDDWKNWIFEIIDSDHKSQEVLSSSIKSKAPGYEGIDLLYALISTPLNLDYDDMSLFDNANDNINLIVSCKLAFLMEQVFVNKEIKRDSGDAPPPQNSSFKWEVSDKAPGIAKSGLEYQASFALNNVKVNGVYFKSVHEQQTFIVRVLNKDLKVYGQEMFVLDGKEIKMRLAEMGVVLDEEFVQIGKYRGKKDILRIVKGPHAKIVSTANGVDEVSLAVNKKLSKLDNINQKAANFLDSKAFTGSLGVIQMLNIGVALNQLNSDRDAKSFINVGGSFFDLSEAILTFNKSCMLKRGILLDSIPKSLKLGIKVFGAFGGIIDTAMCFWESTIAFDKRDNDAGVAWAGAGVAFGVSTYCVVFTSASVLGPVGWIAAGIGLGLIYLAYKLTDSELQTFFKNFLLSDSNETFKKKPGETPVEYGQRILNNRAQLIGDEDYAATMMNPLDAQITLYDLIVCPVMWFNPHHKKSVSSHDYDNPMTASEGIPVTYHTIYSYDVKMIFSDFLTHKEQVEMKGYFFSRGLKTTEKPEAAQCEIISLIQKEGGMELNVRISVLPRFWDRIFYSSELVLAVRLTMIHAQSLYFPYNRGSQERYLGARIRLKDYSVFSNDLSKLENVTIAPLNELKTSKPWK